MHTQIQAPDGPFQRRLDAFTRDIGNLHARDVDALHRARVASRRLRELLPLLGLNAKAARKLTRRFKKTTRQLGVVRELDVLAQLIHEFGQDARYSPAVLSRVGDLVQEARTVARDRLAVELPPGRLERLADRFRRAVEQRESHSTIHRSRGWMWVMEARMIHRAAKAKAAIEATGTIYAPDRLHRTRIELKKLRYTMEVWAELQPAHASRDIGALEAAQELLGRLHDLDVLIARTRQTEALFHPPSLKAWREFGSFVHMLEGDCRTLHARYASDREKLVAVTDRVLGLRADASDRSGEHSARASAHLWPATVTRGSINTAGRHASSPSAFKPSF